MDYELMHKGHSVAVLSISDEGYISGVVKVEDSVRMPLGTMVGDIPSIKKLQGWWDARCIPISRSGVKNLLEVLDIVETRQILTKSLGLSLSDQYWVRPLGSGICWDGVNYFDNDFSDDIGDLLFSKIRSKSPEFSFSSPDNTSDGVLKKRWKILDGNRCLVKGGNSLIPQEPFNEVVATMVADVLGVDHVRYRILWDGGEPYSVCDDFIDPDTELITAHRVLSADDSGASLYRRYVACSRE